MNKENIKGYNNLLIKYLNNLVNEIEKNDDIKNRNFDDVIKRLEEQLSPYNIAFNKQVIKVILTNSFKKYSSILKTYFDSSNIHRIDEKTDDSILSKTMNDVTSNLSLAVNNMDKIKEYRDLIVLIKKNINTHFVQMKNDITNIKYEIDQILNDVIVGYMNAYISTKVNDFNKEILPELYKISDEINYEVEKVIDTTKEEETINVNLERDQFINETMDIEIHEKVENGVLTLQVIDQMGNDNIYYGKEAMEKLISYNQLFESSRPGKKADTSNWPEIIDEPQEEIKKDLDEEVNDIQEQEIIEEQPKKKRKKEKKKKEEEPPKEEIINSQPTPIYEDFNNLTAPIQEENIEISPVEKSETSTISNNNQNIIEKETPDDNNKTINLNDHIDDTTNNNEEMIKDFLSNYKDNLNNNEIKTETNEESNVEESLNKVKSMMNYDNGSFFILEYDNANSERDQYIKNTIGDQIEEDTDNKGLLYLKVTEPSGREVIYTGKQAINMIKDYDNEYEKGTGRKADTTLIDKFSKI